MAIYQFKLARTDQSAERYFTLELDNRMTVLDALFIIQREHDPSLSFQTFITPMCHEWTRWLLPWTRRVRSGRSLM